MPEGASMYEGMPPHSASTVLKLATDKKRATRIVDLFSETFDPAETAAAAFEREDLGDWLVEIFFAEEPDAETVRDLIEVATDRETAARMTIEELVERDWIETSLAGLPPVRAGRFVIHGSHDRKAVRSHEIGIEIEAALAFGTGHHGTTLGCLRLLNGVLRKRRPRHVLDVGTGTGVLAIAASLAIHTRVSAGDIDPIATETARNNALANRAGRYLRPVTAKGLSHPALRGRRRYDLIFANILKRPLMGLAPSIAASATPDATLILSGLLAPDVAGVLSAYGAQKFQLRRRVDIEGWAALEMSRV
jgi:ribosomal protein L11 methyltransferase